jgi:hypothetical protein
MQTAARSAPLPLSIRSSRTMSLAGCTFTSEEQMRRVAVVAGLAGVLVSSFAAVSIAQKSSPFAGLPGTWSGSGQIRLENGQSEPISCRAYYSDRSSGAGIGIALTCASAANKIDLRASLTAQGNNLSGTWEERQFNASGALTGQASGNKLNMSINGGGLSGSMAVTTNGSSQSVQITTQGGTLRGVNIALSRR